MNVTHRGLVIYPELISALEVILSPFRFWYLYRTHTSPETNRKPIQILKHILNPYISWNISWLDLWKIYKKKTDLDGFNKFRNQFRRVGSIPACHPDTSGITHFGLARTEEVPWVRSGSFRMIPFLWCRNLKQPCQNRSGTVGTIRKTHL